MHILFVNIRRDAKLVIAPRWVVTSDWTGSYLLNMHVKMYGLHISPHFLITSIIQIPQSYFCLDGGNIIREIKNTSG